MGQHHREQPEPRDDDVVFVWDDSWDEIPLADWTTANPSLGVPPSPASVETLDKIAHPPDPWTWPTVSEWLDRIAETDQRFALTDWQKGLLVEIGKRGRVDDQFKRIMLAASDRRQYRRRLAEADALFSQAVTGQAFIGPAGATFDECTEPLGWLDEAWAAVRPNPRNDPEMLNRVIDDLATDVTAKIARTECPRFPRADA